MEDSNSEKANALNTLAKGAVEGASAFLGRICNPVAEEFGLLLQDKVRAWRISNFVKVSNKAETIVNKKSESVSPSISPRLLNTVYEESSWIEDEELQNMWAGLFASSCFEKESARNMVYMDILSKMGRADALMFNYFCEQSEFSGSIVENLIEPQPIFIAAGALLEIAELDNFEDIAESLNNLELLGILKQEIYSSPRNQSSYDTIEPNAIGWERTDGQAADSLEVSITNLGFRLYLKALGITQRPSEYIKIKFSASYDWDNEDEI